MRPSNKGWGKAVSLSIVLTTLVCPGAFAQEYPSRPIRLVIPYAPGGGTDTTARNLAAGLSKELGQQVIAENRPGAAGNIAGDLVVQSTPDGYTLLFGASVIATNVAFGPAPAFDPKKALAPISLIAKSPFLVAVTPKLGIRSVKDLVEAARAAPGKMSIGAAQLDVYVEQFNVQSGIQLVHVPYKGGSAVMADVLGGHINIIYAQAPILLPHLRAGTLIPLGVSSDKRLDILPDVPTFVETGSSAHKVSYWYGLFAPAGTPRDVIDRLANATRLVMDQRGPIAQSLRDVGIEPTSSSSQELGRLLEEEIDFWQRARKVGGETVAR